MAANYFEMIKLVAIDAIFVVVLALLLTPLAQFKRAAFAVLKRNFVGYFANPTGYVFLCLFVFLTSAAAFWPHDFFIANLANLDQLNKWLPYIMLVFIPAITMSIWAEERRLGTDELLLTIPAGDVEVVLGKYLAAVAIYSCALVFSALERVAVGVRRHGQDGRGTHRLSIEEKIYVGIIFRLVFSSGGRWPGRGRCFGRGLS